jgi:hypothetical protein
VKDANRDVPQQRPSFAFPRTRASLLPHLDTPSLLDPFSDPRRLLRPCDRNFHHDEFLLESLHAFRTFVESIRPSRRCRAYALVVPFTLMIGQRSDPDRDTPRISIS